jgi:hypothetical protein
VQAVAWLLLTTALGFSSVAGAAPSLAPDRLCSAGTREQATDSRIHTAVELARRQHALFGGQWIDRRGSLAAVGYHEAEFDRPRGENTPTWQRVATFWRALGTEFPPAFRGAQGAAVGAAGLRELLAPRSAAAPAVHMNENQRDAVDSALLRAALVDQPWSAVFISFLMSSSGFSRSEFEFSDTHADYVDQAVLALDAELRGEHSPAAFRACDIARTRPRTGDLVCHTREGAGSVRTLATLRERLALRRVQPYGNGLPMHCDLVTSADEGGDAKLETIGGNVVHSVTLRQMTLNARKYLSRSYFTADDTADCSRAPCRQHLSRRPWVVLLQFRH